jgi:predicted PurR-regulated permease PerM
MATTSPPRDLTRTMLALLCICILIAASFWIMQPFLTSILWAVMIVIATWPQLLWLQERLWKNRSCAVLVMTLVLLLLLIIPLSLAIITIVDKSSEISALFKSRSDIIVPAPPAWLHNLPVVGIQIAEKWQQIAAMPQDEISARLAPYATKALGWIVTQAGSVGMITVHFFLTVIIAAILYSRGERVAEGFCLFARRIAGQQGVDVALHAARAVRGVALGIVVTALLQAILGGAGMMLAGVPAVSLLTAAVFMLCLAQVGPWPVLIPVTVWLFWSGENLWGGGMLVWTFIVSTIDNFIRPFLIKRGADIPLLLIFAGVIGGLMAFGIVGLFIGPVILAVTYTLLEAWVNGSSAKETEAEHT